MKAKVSGRLATLTVLMILCFAIGPPGAALGGSPPIQVTTTQDELNDDGDCSLREAVEAANTDAAVDACRAGSGADVIKLQPFATYTLSVAGVGEDGNQTGDLDILDDVTVDAKGSTIDAAGLDRVFDIHPGLTVEINRATVTGGDVDDLVDPLGFSDDGGGILNRGSTVSVNESTILGNVAGNGGGIANADGAMALTDCIVAENTSTESMGGGIMSEALSVDTTLTMSHCVVSGNLALGTNAFLGPGNGSAGGIANTVRFHAGSGLTATLTVNDSSIAGNAAVGNTYNLSTSGGLLNFASQPTGTAVATLTDTTVSGNTAIVAGGIQSGTFSPAATVSLTLIRSTVSDNVSTPGGPAAIFTGIAGGIQNFNGTMLCANSTISGNVAQGNPAFSQGFGGGIFNVSLGRPTVSTLVNTTVSGNLGVLGGGVANLGVPVGASPPAWTEVAFQNTIVALNGAAPGYGDCFNAYVLSPDGYNLDSDYTCGFAHTGDPLLGPLQNNGGPTETHALLPGSPAIDAANDTTCAAPPIDGVDQRGRPRAPGQSCDLGSYELLEEEDD